MCRVGSVLLVGASPVLAAVHDAASCKVYIGVAGRAALQACRCR
jgi:hypothetical protein